MGPKWQRIRSILNPQMLKPRHVSAYSDTINEVVTDFIWHVARLRETSGGGVMVNDLAGELYKFAFEGENKQNKFFIKSRTERKELHYLFKYTLRPASAPLFV